MSCGLDLRMTKSERKTHNNIFQQGLHDLQLETINGIEFTHREVDIIACILSGKTAKKIALFLSISPKTVENHIRNIMLKLGCRAQENIIDFVERSNKFSPVKRHYSNLLLQFFFESELRKIYATAVKENISCLIVMNSENKEYMSFASQFINHLKVAGLKTLVTTDKHTELGTETVNYIAYLHSCSFMDQAQASNDEHSSEINNVIQLSNNHSASIISVFFNRHSLAATPQKINANRTSILIEHENYYFLVLETLKKILRNGIDENISDFRKQHEVLSNPSRRPSVADEPDYVRGLVNISAKKSRAVIMVCILITCLVGFIGYSFFSASNVSGSFFEWVRGNEYFDSEVAAKYIESLEEEERKLGGLDGRFDTLRFLQLRKNFLKASNMLVKLVDNDVEKAGRLVIFLKDQFPATNRTNEKIHKLFYAMAAYYGKLSFIEKLLENVKISFLDFKDYYGNTAPMLAAAGNHAKTFEWLVNKDSLFINHSNIEGNSALILAALNLPSDAHMTDDEKKQSISVLKKIIEHDRHSIYLKGHKGCTPLLVAGAKGNITAVQYLLGLMAPGNEKKQLQILEQERNADGNNLMLLAAYNGTRHLIDWLHNKNISTRQRNKYNTSAFMQAASGGNVDTMDLLYRRNGPSLLTEQNNFGQTALFLAAHDNRVNAFQWILEKLKENSFNKDQAAIAAYIKNARNADGDSLLHVLINGMSDTNKVTEITMNTGLLDILLDYIDVNTRATFEPRKTGDTPLMRAANYGNLALVKYLIEKCGANANQENTHGETAIYYAAMRGRGQYAKVIEYLWSLKAASDGKSVNEIKKKTSGDLLLTAAQYGQKSVIKWLLTNNPELIESRTAHGENALSLAVLNQHIDIIEFIFAWDQKTAVRLALEKRTNASENVIEKLISQEKNGVDKSISLSKYLAQKLGISSFETNNKSTSHSDSSYNWKSLEIGINGLSTSFIQPWSPYYLHYDTKQKIKSLDDIP